MPPRRKENVAATSREFLPNQEETHVQEPKLSVVEKLGQKSDMHTAGILATYAHISNRLVEELTATRIEEISQTMSKVVVDCLKKLLSKPNKSITGKYDSDKEASKGSNQPKKVKEGSGSSKAGDVHRPISVFSSRDKGYTPPQRKEKVHAEGNQSNVQEENKENDKPPVNHVHVVTSPLYRHTSYKDVTSRDLQGVNVGVNTRGAQSSKEELEEKDHYLFPSMTFVDLNVTNLRALTNDKEEYQGSNQTKVPEIRSGSCKAGDLRCLKTILPIQEEGSTPPSRRDNRVHMMNNPLYQPGEFEYVSKHGFQRANDDAKSRGAQPTKEEFKCINYCKYHHAFNHDTRTCWPFENFLQEKNKIKSYWIPKGMISDARGRFGDYRENNEKCQGYGKKVHHYSKKKLESVASWPKNQHSSKRLVASHSKDQIFIVRSSYTGLRSQKCRRESTNRES